MLLWLRIVRIIRLWRPRYCHMLNSKCLIEPCEGKFKSAYVYCPLLKRTQLTCTTWVESLSKTRDCITAWSFHWSPFVRRFVYKEPRVKFMDSRNQIGHCRKWLYCLTRTKHNSTSAHCIYKWNTPVAGRKEWRVGFPEQKHLPRSSSNSPAIVCTWMEFLEFRLALLFTCS